MIKQIILWSDFYDYYDHWFPLVYHTRKTPDIGDDQYLLDRLSYGGLSRDAMLFILETVGYRVPRWTSKSTLDNAGWEIPLPLVCHTDIQAHRGEGKILINDTTDNRSVSRDDRQVMVSFVPPSTPATSYRLLSIGFYKYVLRYQSDDPWRSNVGDVTITLLEKTPTSGGLVDQLSPHKTTFFNGYPLWSIDFIQSADDGCFYALDFNSAPQIRGTPLEDILWPEQVYTMLEEFVMSTGMGVDSR